MPEVTQFKKALERTVQVPINEGETLAVKWSPQNVSPEFWDQMEADSRAAVAAREKGEQFDRNPFDLATRVLLPLMTWWDLTVEGEPLPITVENIVSFGLPFVMAASDAIQQDFKIGESTKKVSGAS